MNFLFNWCRLLTGKHIHAQILDDDIIVKTLLLVASWPVARPPPERKTLAVLPAELTISVVTIVNLSHCKFGFPLSSMGKILTPKYESYNLPSNKTNKK